MRRGRGLIPDQLGDAEIQDLHVVGIVRVIEQEDVLGLEIPVHDPPLVGGGKG